MTAMDEDDGPLADHPADAGGAGPELTYPGAPDSVIARWNTRRHPVDYRHGDALPPLDTDLAALASQIIPNDLPALTERLPPYRRKLWKLRMQLPGQPELAALNAILIVNLRRSAYPDHAPALFLRIWREHGDSLMRQLSGRWLISSIITFGDVGETEAQRRIGLSMNVLFSMIKLYEAERTYSGYRSDKVFDQPMARRSPLPVGMQSFSFLNGGLDYNLLAPIWKEALAEPVAGRLACHLLERLNADPNNIFRRIRRMSAARQAQQPPAGDAEPGADDDSGET